MARSYSLELGMLTKKMYCSHCGKPLIKKEVSNTYKRGEPGFKAFLCGRIVSVFSYTEVKYTYFCPACRNEISYDDQIEVERAQKKLGRKIVSAEEIPDGSHKSRMSAKGLVLGFCIVTILLAFLVLWLKR